MSDKGILLEAGTNELEILEFYVDAILDSGEVERNSFGVNVAKVMEVIEVPGLTPPKHPLHPCFMGTIPLRGMILPVLDLGVWLGFPRQAREHEVIIVTEFSNTLAGFLVSGVVEIHRLGWNDVESPSGYLGRINVDSIVGVVAREDRFIQLLDLEFLIGQFAPDTRRPETKAGCRSERRYTALVADDSHMIRGLLQDTLGEANFALHVVSNGEEGLKYLMELKTKALAEQRDIDEFLHIVISDIEMPRMDGFTLTKKIKEDPVLAKLPVILYSSLITPELRHKGESVKADEQVSKPDLHKLPGIAVGLIERA